MKERAVYAIAGEIEIGGERHGPQQLLVLRPGDRIVLRAVTDAHVVMVGGAAMDGPRHIWWNFVLRARTASKPPRPTGKPAASISFPAIPPSSFHCRNEMLGVQSDFSWRNP